MPQPTAADIFNDAIELAPEEWPAFLDRACGDDFALRTDVESLLQLYVQHPPPPVAAAGVMPDRVGRYTILGELGRGGMGRVFLAEDPSLGRRVALKMLPSRLGHDPQRLARFRREAKILASLNHPYIATVFSLEQVDEIPFLTMEWVEGEPLSTKLAALGGASGLDISEVLRIADQTATALESAHERGIIHRDLKPANVILTPQRNVKILDFGLAKMKGTESAAEPPSESAAEQPHSSSSRIEREDRTDSDTLSPEQPWIDPRAGAAFGFATDDEAGFRGDTIPGAILGSPGYMSPEQIRGGEVGPQTDLWAFGCLVFECLTGRPAFPGRTAMERMSAALEDEPNWPMLPDPASASLVGILRRCLVKDAAYRISEASHVRSEVARIARDVGGDRTTESIGSRLIGTTLRQRISRGLLAAAIVALVILWPSFRSKVQLPPLESDAPRPRQQTFSGAVFAFDLSYDDETVAYATFWGALVLHDLETGNDTEILRLAGLRNLRWSPDGTTILAGSRDSSGNHVTCLVDLESRAVTWIGPTSLHSCDWTHDGEQVVGLTLVPTRAGNERWVVFDRSSGDTTSFPLDPDVKQIQEVQCSRSSSALLFSGTTNEGEQSWWVAPRIGESALRLPLRNARVRWSSRGDALLYVTMGEEPPTLRRLAIDLERGRFEEKPEVIELLERASLFTPFHHGPQVLCEISSAQTTLWLLERVDRNWTREALLSGTGGLSHPRLSPDGRSVAFGSHIRNSRGISLVSLDDGVYREVVRDPSGCNWIAWSPDGRTIAYRSYSEPRVWTVDLVRGEPHALSKERCHGYLYWYPASRLRYQPVSTPDQNYAFLDTATGVEEPLFRGLVRGTAFQSSISPDERWMAVAGNRNGIEHVAVWLIDLTDGSETILLDGTAAPIGWSDDGSYVFATRSKVENRTEIMEQCEVIRIRVDNGSVETVAELPPGDLLAWSDADISPDGTRIVATIIQRGADLWVSDGQQPR